MAVLDTLVYELTPIMTDDLMEYIEAISAMFTEVELYSLESEVVQEDGSTYFYEPWERMLSVRDCPDKALPYLAGLTGVTLQVGIDPQDARQLISDRPAQRRGTVRSIVEAAQRHLTGNKRVLIRERDENACPQLPAYGLTVITMISETPDPGSVLTSIQSVKPAGIFLNYRTLEGQDWQQVKDDYADWTAVKSAYATWQAVRDDSI